MKNALTFTACLILGLLFGCGHDDSKSQSPAESTAPVAEATPVTVASKSQEEPSAFLAQDRSGLPSCDQTRESELAYVKTEGAFYACASGSWDQVEIKGEKGEQGVTGEVGAKGEDGRVVSSNMWLDPMADIYWTLSSVTLDYPSAATSCGAKWHLPSQAELVTALGRGIPVDVSGVYWLSDKSNNSNMAYRVGMGSQMPALAQTLCVENAQ